MGHDLFTSTAKLRRSLRQRLTMLAPDEQEALPTILEQVGTFCAKHVDSDRIDRDGGLGADLLAGVAARGWFGLTVPREYQGVGLSTSAATRVIAEVTAHNGSLGTCLGLNSGLALHGLVHAANPELRRRYLPEVALGHRLTAFAATESDAGSDIASVRTRLRESQGVYKLSGEKSYVTNGGLAGLITVLAQSPGLGGARSGHSLVLVDPSWPGVTRGLEERKLGLKGSSTLSIRFDDVVVPEDHVLGEPGQGLAHAHAALCWGRTFMAAGCLGTARAAFESAHAHASTRRQFGRPLIGFPLVRETLYAAKADLYAIESTLRLACFLLDDGVGDAALSSTILKILASEGAFGIVDDGLQLMGAAGYLEDYGMARRFRDVRVTRIFEGSNDVLRVSLAAAVTAWSTRALKTCAPPPVPRALDSQAERFSESCRALAGAIEFVKRRWGFRLFTQQSIARDLANAVIALFAAFSVLERVSAEQAVGLVEAVCLPTPELALDRQLERALRALQRVTTQSDATTWPLTQASNHEA